MPSSVAGSGARPEWLDDPVADRLGQVQARPVALERVDDPQRLLVVLEPRAEALAQAAVEHLLADVPERRVAEVVAEPDRLDEVLVQRERARDRARDLRDLERVRQPRAVVVAGRARRTPASCASGAGTPCCGRSGRGRAGTGVRSPQSGSGAARSAG